MPTDLLNRQNHRPPPTHYDVLSLPFPHGTETDTGSSLSKEAVKAAYRRALLRYHPDKTQALSSLKNSSQGASTISGSGVAVTSPRTTIPSPSRKAIYSIDQIVLAYETLLDPSLRAAYDRSLLHSSGSSNQVRADANGDDAPPATATHIGVEVFDLDDLDYEEQQQQPQGGNKKVGVWSRGCRCGAEGQGYILTEADLERESAQGEIYVGCRGCSLFIKVLFATEEDDAGDGGNHEDEE